MMKLFGRKKPRDETVRAKPSPETEFTISSNRLTEFFANHYREFPSHIRSQSRMVCVTCGASPLLDDFGDSVMRAAGTNRRTRSLNMMIHLLKGKYGCRDEEDLFQYLVIKEYDRNKDRTGADSYEKEEKQTASLKRVVHLIAKDTFYDALCDPETNTTTRGDSTTPGFTTKIVNVTCESCLAVWVNKGNMGEQK